MRSNTKPANGTDRGHVAGGMRFIWIGMLVAGCGSTATRDHEALGAQIHAAEAGLPAPPRGALWGDGYGVTQREAVLDARRAVSEQIVSEVRSRSSNRVEEAQGTTQRQANLEVHTRSDFEHAELIETLAVSKRPGGFVARAVLDKAKAAAVYAEELKRARERLGALGPVVEAGLASHDTAVLLSADTSPGQIMALNLRKAQVLAVLGHPEAMPPPAESVALEKRASVARRGARLRLKVEGKVSKSVRQAALKEIGALLTAAGCRFEEAPHDAPAEGVPIADATLRLVTRDHEERDLKWRYLGLDLNVVDARSGRPVFRFDATPELVHAGGPTWPRADAALSRRLGEKLRARAAEFAGITCR